TWTPSPPCRLAGIVIEAPQGIQRHATTDHALIAEAQRHAHGKERRGALVGDVPYPIDAPRRAGTMRLRRRQIPAEVHVLAHRPHQSGKLAVEARDVRHAREKLRRHINRNDGRRPLEPAREREILPETPRRSADERRRRHSVSTPRVAYTLGLSGCTSQRGSAVTRE